MSRTSQIANRNFLSPTGFKFVLDRSPKVAFFCNQANIPDIDLAVAVQSTRLGRKIPHPGDELNFGDLTLRFMIDEDLSNYMEIQNWMRGLGYPNNLGQLYDLQNEYFGDSREDSKLVNTFSDATLLILNSSQISSLQVRFKDIFPYSLSTLSFDATQTDTEYFTAEVSFKYTIYTITNMGGTEL
jgi:hypothetical protein